MRFAYSDSPYLGCCGLYKHHHPDGRCWDAVETHALLIERLSAEFPDGWAYSLSSTSLRRLLPLCPEDVRIGSWVKPFGIYKPNVNPAYVWEPVIFHGGRGYARYDKTVRDWVEAPAVKENITLRRGLTGVKPQKVCFWLFEVLNMKPGDEFIDLFPGSGAVSEAWEIFKGSRAEQQSPLFAVNE